ncbi:hypothetical protein R4K89_00170 [Brachyspira intermedia]|uniref:hypothetical protein n=1 Tax=Brachyspira intermedia TaxID=84377 RepID=UPI003006A973
MSFKNIITFGAAGRIENAQQQYEKTFNKYKRLENKYKRMNKELVTIFENVVQTKINAQNTAKKITNIKIINEMITANKLSIKSKKEKLSIVSVNMNYITNSLEAGDVIMNAMKGSGIALSVGTAAAPAALWLVSTFGTASTGVAISSLSGAAAANAALAALGGGAVAAGGGGMAAGAAVLGALGPIVGVSVGLVVMPIFSHLSANKKIKQIEEEEYEIINAIDNIKEAIQKNKIYENRSYEIISAINKGIEAFNHQYKITEEVINKCNNDLTIQYILNNKNSKESKEIFSLIAITQELLKIRDTPIIDK